ncbi:hypothetical protein FTO74_09305 [Granulicella sp. WH15]|uniref:hypothetical protein n=1 Tax=Granulicella sp. WH15 TaxID=2602070 RepID=UPI001366FDD4|nr:hypothetical protein [Granulicella sp. WH15]QHN03543.1 hypothetical protein FTO74_09305 [Granulicella sp. WH15]
MRLLALALVFLATQALAQEPQTLTTRFTELLQRFDNGHSPTPDEILAANDQPQPTPGDLATAVPLILRAIDSPDKDVRAYTLTALVGLEAAPPTAEPKAPENSRPANATPVPVPVLASAFKPEVARALAPAIPRFGARLTDESETNRLLAAAVLGGFIPNPPPLDYAILCAYLALDNSVGTTGQAVVEALLGLGPVPDAAATAVSSYLRRRDQTADTRASLIDAVSTHANQSLLINKTLLGYLNSDDSSVRSRLILSLPQLDLPPDLFADTKSRVAALAANEQESLQVINAAKAVTPCWDRPHMTTPCPIYQ